MTHFRTYPNDKHRSPNASPHLPQRIPPAHTHKLCPGRQPTRYTKPLLTNTGTLMAPEILHRVIHGRPEPEPWQKAMLSFKPAILHGYRRHRVRGADYPGIVPCPSNGSTEESGNAAVLGTVVSGLTDGDVHRLDIFEGSEYVKERVRVRVLAESLSVGGRQEASIAKNPDRHLKDVLDAAGAEFADEREEVEALTYVYVAGQDQLEDAEWDFEAFKRDKMAWWVGADESEW
ncbi:gamma-glutamylcyclotransferase family protein [Aspergillus thermomutatus]|uniref:Putative gamma-glutamylcyclotransferase n=1 Tax=Aspergillus thermomutatus TaxID=41047 RepID=A0A397GUJ2_ASPTH|nr:uncharacterized protein CDV56_105345 [Aspergillus thermomutatus]RHZ54682.1 hypothetical protein CDV56_105345 [Aspergillus thermomutatus]